MELLIKIVVVALAIPVGLALEYMVFRMAFAAWYDVKMYYLRKMLSGGNDGNSGNKG